MIQLQMNWRFLKGMKQESLNKTLRKDMCSSKCVPDERYQG
jgi:hypothetical protein